MIFDGFCQLLYLVALYPVYKLYKKVLRVQRLTNYFKKGQFPRRSVCVFVSIYVLRSFVVLIHSIWAFEVFLYLSRGSMEASQVIQGESYDDVMMLLESLVDACTIVLCFIFFVVLGRHMQQVREDLNSLQTLKRKKRPHSIGASSIETKQRDQFDVK